MTKHTKLEGLIAAGFTPQHPDGSLNLALVPALVDHLIGQGVTGIYACGSTGEGPLLSSDERRQVAEAYIEASAGRLPVAVQVGHNSLAESCALARHAVEAGADIISALSPSYFQPADVQNLVDCMAEIAEQAPQLPFYYYHIPRLTGTDMSMVAFLEAGGGVIPNLAGIKYSDFKLFEYQDCLHFQDGAYDILWGCDEMLLSALATGARAAVGSTYNMAAPIYLEVMRHFAAGHMEAAQQAMLRSVQYVNACNGRHGAALTCLKATMAMIGLDCGPTRMPLRPLDPDAFSALQHDLEKRGFFDWIQASQ